MKSALKDISTPELVQLFAENCVEQDKAIFNEEVSKFKKIFSVMFQIDEELRERGWRGQARFNRAVRASKFASEIAGCESYIGRSADRGAATH